MDNRPIGIFDSGIGGLSVLQQAIKMLPKEHYIYYADEDHVPYGEKTTEEITCYVNDAVKFMLEKGVKAIVIACNTATSVAIENLRKLYHIPIIGMEPAAKPAIEMNQEKRIMLLATPVTIKEEKLRRLLEKIDIQHKIDLVPLPNLVKFAESETFDDSIVENYLLDAFENYNLDNYSEVILGCTHFNYFRPSIQKVFNNKAKLLDGNEGTIHRLKEVLSEHEELGTNELSIEYYSTGRKVDQSSKLEKIQRLQDRLSNVEQNS